MSRVEFFEDAAGEHRWRVRAANGEIVAAGEGYSRPQDCERGFVTAATAVSVALGQHFADWQDQHRTAQP